MKSAISVLLAFSVLLSGCAGREANPVAIYIPGDENRSCAGLHGEMAQLQSDMQRIMPKTNKGVSNALWATAGVFLIVPFFFMDLKDAEKIEFDAMRQRYNRLLIYAGERQCDLYGLQQERIPSIEEMKETPKQQQKTQENTGTAAATNQLKTCLNCGEKIGALEESHVFEDNIVCATCYLKLEKQKEQAKQTKSSDAETKG